MSVTRDDVARRAGVSPATVSYVVNRGPRPVSAKARAKVLRAIEETGYEPSDIARGLRLKKTNTFGIILPDNSNPFFAALERGVSEAAHATGYGLVTCHSGYDVDRETGFVSLIRSKQVDGVVLVPAAHEVPALDLLLQYKIPVVVADRKVSTPSIPCVTADDFRAGLMATKHLLDLGHRSIAFIARPSYLKHSADRLRGYRAALKEFCVEPRPEWVVKGGFTFEAGAEAMRRVLDLSPRPTAVFAYNDIQAIGAMRAALEAGLTIPGDLSIVGFDDIPVAAYMTPPLTTVSQPKHEMGRLAAELLVKMLAGPSPSGMNHIILKTELIVRASTAPPPRG